MECVPNPTGVARAKRPRHASVRHNFSRWNLLHQFIHLRKKGMCHATSLPRILFGREVVNANGTCYHSTMKRYSFLLKMALMLLLTIGLSACIKKNEQATATPTPKPPEKVNTIPQSERPYVVIAPNPADRELILTFYALKKPAQKGEYEIEYQTGELVQGAFGTIDVDALPDSSKVLLGTRSAGGKTTYHEGVTGGTLLLRFDTPEKYVLRNEWSYLENKTKETSAASRDSKFRVEGKGLASVKTVTILQTPGLPATTDTEPISLPYSVGITTTPSGNVTVSLRLTEDVSSATVLGWDGKSWHKLKTTVADKTATATDKLYEAYVAVR